MNDIDITIVNWFDKQTELYSVRRAVFIEEQNIAERIEIDGRDPDCFHVLASDTKGRPVGTARMDDKGKIGRMAVLQNYRRQGIGRKMIQALMDYGRKNSITDFHVSSQVTAIGFYRKMGFEPFGEEFLEAGIKHINMKLKNPPK
ncbi:MAG: GNAT family N-acetyltransferase [Sedimentisphaerales bacterium]